MYQPVDLASFAFFQFARGLEGLTDEEARTRLTKADGSQMNAISWIVAHVARQWRMLAERAIVQPRPSGLEPFRTGSDDPTPPPLELVLQALHDAKAANDWIAGADDALMCTVREGITSRTANESAGTYLMRDVLHTWFHTGEINAIRQMLGHPEIAFVGPYMIGNMEWHSLAQAKL